MILRSVPKLRRKLLRHGREVLLFVKRLPEKLAQLRINRLGIIVTQEAEAGVDLLFEQNAVRFRKARQHLDEKRQQIRSLRNAARFAQGAPHPAPAPPLQPIGKRRHPLHGAVDFVCD